MRLLNATTLQCTEFSDDVPPYAILSHTWGPEEVTFQDISSPERGKKKGFAKITGCCRQALTNNLSWVWIDTCCIDKSASAELSEAINSMYEWYRKSRICYAYLEDVSGSDTSFPEEEFRSARWFTRGWCLQELIAPEELEFYTVNWSAIGTKRSLSRRIEAITTIPQSVLLHRRPLEQCTIAQKMSWASKRSTTRIEDEAYCLLGLFGVHMPMLYGEGTRAFCRLQEEIINHVEDYSFLLWTGVPWGLRLSMPAAQLPVFAPRPASFHPDGPISDHGHPMSYREIAPWLIGDPELSLRSWTWSTPQMTNRGLRVFLPGMKTEVPVMRERQYLEVRYVIWTGYLYRHQLVCVSLERDYYSGPERYVRSPRNDGWPELQLLSPKMLESMKPAEIYLNTSSAAWLKSPPDYWGEEDYPGRQVAHWQAPTNVSRL